MKYTDIKLSDKMQKSLEEAGYSIATEIQAKAIPLAMSGKDIIGQAQTGTGKTASFAIPIIENTDIENKDIQHLVLAPTRELATQIMNEFKTLGREHKVNVVQIIGGISYDRQREKLKTKPQIIIGTPGRIKDYLERGKLKIHNIKSFTLDEVDQLLSIGFQKDIEFINDKLPRDKQMFFYSATFGTKVKSLAKKMIKGEAEEVKVSQGLSSAESVEQHWIVSKDHKKFEILKLFLQLHNPVGAIIFCRTKKGVDTLVTNLKKANFKVDGIQGDMEQHVRSKVIKNFREGVFNIVVGTDVLARGIDVDKADYVYNYDLPEEIENYTHRIGRVGRAGRTGLALSFVKPAQVGYMNKILRETNSKKAQEIQLPSQEELDKIFDQQRYDLLNSYLTFSNKHQLATMIEEAYSKEDMAKMLSVVIKKTVKTFKVEDLKDDGKGQREDNRRGSGNYNRGRSRNRTSGGGNRSRSSSSRSGGGRSSGRNRR